MNPTGTQLLKTRRLILRPFRIEDAEDMYRNWASDPEVTRYLTWPTHESPDITRALLTSWTATYTDGHTFNWAIEWAENGSVIGNISVVSQDENTETAEIGYCMSRAYWGQGIMPEALRAVIDYLFDTAGFRRITAHHDVRNPNSGKVMEKAGMRREGLLRGAARNNTGICDVVCYGLLREDRSQAEKHPKADVQVRFAREDELDRVNELRRQVNDLHVEGKPNVFKPGFCDELRDYVHAIWEDPRKEIVVAQCDGTVCGIAILNHIFRPENPFMYERDFLDIDEFCVDEAFRRRGVAAAMVRFIRDFAREKGFRRIELNMWTFNHGALAFYETAGFKTYRKYMEMFL